MAKFKQKTLKKYITLPKEAEFKEAKHGNRGLGWMVDVKFELPEHRDPEEWLLSIAKESGISNPKVGYYKNDLKKVSADPIEVEKIDADEWVVKINKGYLSYNLKSKGLYRYVWTNN